ncbi:MAG: hypothetical protein ACD_37C00464G0005 [uncultured bacterium]|nr:MAG: hypothetical protein ACD_37C00464G0005 [uncultured bacterium]OGH48658.1 MAG: hypothetical protein A3I54_03280 [Candidatus Levybacteria bacterium RIFCSPLOWO2_02_FULL_41_11]
MISCTFENGNKNNLRHVVVDNLLVKGNKILLVKRAKRVPSAGKWGLVGGFMEKNETLKEAVKREILEETGFEIKNINLLIVIDLPFRSPDEERQNVSFVFFCEAKEKKGNPDWESTEQKWFELDNLPKKEEFAFDHYKMIEIYLDYKKNNRSLPIFQSPI